MSAFIFEDDQIVCSCLHPESSSYRIGLIPPQTAKQIKNLSVPARKMKSRDIKQNNSGRQCIKKSLKRNKISNINHQRRNTLEDPQKNLYANQFLKQTKNNCPPFTMKYIKQPFASTQPQIVSNKEKLQGKVELSRNQKIRNHHEVKKLMGLNTPNNTIEIQSISDNYDSSFTFLKRKKQNSDTKSQQHKKQNEQIKEEWAMEGFSIYPREIQSIVDEEVNSDQVSEVIGWGWNTDGQEKNSQKQKNQVLASTLRSTLPSQLFSSKLIHP